MSNENNKTKSILQKLYNYRLKIDRKGKTILNFSSLFSLACLIFAPHMTIAGLILSLILGYHITLETEENDENLEQTFRQVAETVKKTASAAARTIQGEVEKAKISKEANASGQAAAPTAKEQAQAGHEILVDEKSEDIQEIVEDLEKEAAQDPDDTGFHGNPAVYRSAYSAVAGTVPTLKVEEENAEPEPDRNKYMKM